MTWQDNSQTTTKLLNRAAGHVVNAVSYLRSVRRADDIDDAERDAVASMADRLEAIQQELTEMVINMRWKREMP